MKKLILCFVILVSFVSSAIAGALKTSDDFENSTFAKKYHISGKGKATPLKNGKMDYGYDFSLAGNTKITECFAMIEVMTKSKTDKTISGYGVMFHDESKPGVTPTPFTPEIKTIVSDFFSSIDSGINVSEAIAYVKANSKRKLNKIADAPAKSIGGYKMRVGTVLHELIISIDKK
jgi:hypothetical protein